MILLLFYIVHFITIPNTKRECAVIIKCGDETYCVLTCTYLWTINAKAI